MEIKKITPEMYEALKKPLPPEAIKQHPTKTFLSTIKAIYVTERLNDVFGCGSWTLKTEHITTTEKSMVVVKACLEIQEYGIYYESFGGNDNGGEASKNFDLGDAFKGATTDAITKIGSYMGIAIDVFKGKGNNQNNPVEINKLLESIKICNNINDLQGIWNINEKHHSNQVFKSAMNIKKQEILKNGTN